MTTPSDRPVGAPVEATDEHHPLRLVRGDATPEEVAALVAVLSAVSGGEREPAARHTSQWSARERGVRQQVSPGPGAWRASGCPR